MTRPAPPASHLQLHRARRAVTGNRAETRPDTPDPRLRGRVYAVPFDKVWNAALRLAREDRRRWEVLREDDGEGVIEAEAPRLLSKAVDDVRIEIGLDENAQTRVDVTSSSRSSRPDLGANARRIHRFLRSLDRAILPDLRR